MKRSHVTQGARSDEFLASFLVEEDGEQVLRNVTVRSTEIRERLTAAVAQHAKAITSIHADVHSLAEQQVAEAEKDAAARADTTL